MHICVWLLKLSLDLFLQNKFIKRYYFKEGLKYILLLRSFFHTTKEYNEIHITKHSTTKIGEVKSTTKEYLMKIEYDMRNTYIFIKTKYSIRNNISLRNNNSIFLRFGGVW